MEKILLPHHPAAEPSVSVKVSHHLQGDVALSIHTRKAQSLCQGSWEHHDIGLFQFAAVMTTIYQSSDQDDPYADWHIARIKKELEGHNQAIKAAIADYTQALQQYRGLEVEIFGSRHPLKLLLDFATPLSYLAAYTISDLDYLLRQAFTFKRLSILPESSETAYRLLWAVRSTLAKCRKWHHTGVTRQDIRDNNPKAERAQKWMGKVSKRILNQKNKSEKKAVVPPKKK